MKPLNDLLGPAIVLLLAGDVTQASSLDTFLELLKSEPSAAAMAERKHFAIEGLSFDYPAVLRERASESDDTFDTWSMEYGMFELELMEGPASIDAEAYLDSLATVFNFSEKMSADQEPGRTMVICGKEVTSARIGVTVFDDDRTTYEAIDLPRSAHGDGRILVFEDDPEPPHDDEPTKLANATWAMVLESIKCESSETAPDFTE